MNPALEIRRLIELMPASGRMLAKISHQPSQTKVIDTVFPLPWHRDRRIYINFDKWNQLSQPQRDLLLLRTISWLLGVKWLKPDLYQGVTAAGVVGAVVELAQGDAVGVVTAGGLAAFALTRLWQSTRNSEAELTADEAAIRIAQRRGYHEPEAARHLLEGIEAAAKLEGRSGLSFTELVRAQNLRAVAGISPVGVPQKIRQEG